jgi:hypothetical protein
VVKHPTEREIFAFITGDFQCTWDALAEKSEGEAGNRGNFMFALQAGILLEWVGQLCKSDCKKKALGDFATELQKIEPKYFTPLDDKCLDHPQTFKLPGVGSADPRKSLLSAMWDLIRNGQAHQYQDLIVKLTDGKQWGLGLKGVKHGWPLSEVAAKRSSLQHLSYCIDADGDLMLIVHPGVFFLDIRDAAKSARLLSRGLTVTHFPRGGPAAKFYQFDVKQLEVALQRGGHVKL